MPNFFESGRGNNPLHGDDAYRTPHPTGTDSVGSEIRETITRALVDTLKVVVELAIPVAVSYVCVKLSSVGRHQLRRR